MKTFFLSRVTREKILLLGLAAIIALMWLGSVANRAVGFIGEYRAATDTLQAQQKILNSRDEVQARADAARRQLDAGGTFDSVRLESELDAMANAAGIANKTIGDAHTDKGTQFAVNSAQITMRNVDYASLVKFYEDLKKRSPYIGLDQMTIQSSPANVNQLIASLRVSSVEITK